MAEAPCSNGRPNLHGDGAKFFFNDLSAGGWGQGCKLMTRFLRINAADEVLSVNEGFP